MNNLYGYAMSKFLPTSGFKWIHHKEFDLSKYTSNSSRGCVTKVDLKYPQELRELHNDYSSALDKKEIKREMLPEVVYILRKRRQKNFLICWIAWSLLCVLIIWLWEIHY